MLVAVFAVPVLLVVEPPLVAAAAAAAPMRLSPVVRRHAPAADLAAGIADEYGLAYAERAGGVEMPGHVIRQLAHEDAGAGTVVNRG